MNLILYFNKKIANDHFFDNNIILMDGISIKRIVIGFNLIL